MRGLTLAFLIVMCAVKAILAQPPIRQPPGAPTPKPPTPTEQAIQRGRDISNRSNELRNIEKFPVRNEKQRKELLKVMKARYRQPTDEEMKVLAPDEADAAKYKGFARKKKSGLLKLVSDSGCSATPGLVKATEECAKYTMPGAGSAYSFRERKYRLIRLSDLNFKKNAFLALGVLTHGIMVNLGDVSLEDVDLNTPGVEYISRFKTARTMNKAGEIANKLMRGMKNEGFVYGSILRTKPDSTYVLRSIAYRGEAFQKAAGIVYNELDFDKRRDILIAFRVVSFVPGESVTIIWKELKTSKSPKIKANK